MWDWQRGLWRHFLAICRLAGRIVRQWYGVLVGCRGKYTESLLILKTIKALKHTTSTRSSSFHLNPEEQFIKLNNLLICCSVSRKLLMYVGEDLILALSSEKYVVCFLDH